MNINGYRHRVVDSVIESYLRTFGAVCVEGPKWCGKTWSSRNQARSEFLVGDPAGNFQNRRLAELDASLACAILKLTPERLIGDTRFMGFLFEGLVERDLRVYATSFGAEVLHYQDYKNNEIDAVVEMGDGEWAAIEVKLGANQEDSAAESLLAIRDEIAKDKDAKLPKSLIVILGKSTAAYTRKDGVHVVPISALYP